jgi:hypothetical protein
VKRWSRIWVVLAAALVLAALLSAPGTASGYSAWAIDNEEADCTQIPPEEVPPAAVATDKKLPVEVRVLTEAADLAMTKGYMQVAKDAYSRIGITLRVRYQTVVPPAEWVAGRTVIGGGPDQPTIFDFMRSIYGGERPEGVDLVYFMTRDWDGGFAACIGGVRFADLAFAFGSIDYATEDLVPSPTVNEGVIAAHEIGHLLGAQHHYANCAEALPSGALRGDTNPCTTMWPAAANASSTFGLLERSFIRSYTAQYAKG